MGKQRTPAIQSAARRAALRKRIRGLYAAYDARDWARCFEHIDPRLREAGRVSADVYAASLAAFHDRYGPVEKIWHLDVSPHDGPAGARADTRPFAYAYIFWRDVRQEFHVFRERWVLDGRRWYTRVVGLVTHDAPPPPGG